MKTNTLQSLISRNASLITVYQRNASAYKRTAAHHYSLMLEAKAADNAGTAGTFKDAWLLQYCKAKSIKRQLAKMVANQCDLKAELKGSISTKPARKKHADRRADSVGQPMQGRRAGDAQAIAAASVYPTGIPQVWAVAA